MRHDKSNDLDTNSFPQSLSRSLSEAQPLHSMSLLFSILNLDLPILDSDPCPQSRSSIPIALLNLNPEPNPYLRSQSLSEYLSSILIPILVLDLDHNPYPDPTLLPQSLSRCSSSISILDSNPYPRSQFLFLILTPASYLNFSPYPLTRSSIPISIFDYNPDHDLYPRS
jgi:hypothetical protein